MPVSTSNSIFTRNLNTHITMAEILTILNIIACTCTVKVAADEFYDNNKPVKAGLSYFVGPHKFVIPTHLEIKGNGVILYKSFMEKQYLLLNKVNLIMGQQGINYWCSGGTSLGIARHGGLIPWDDDCDIHVEWAWKDIIFSHAFAYNASCNGIEVFEMIFQDNTLTNKTNAAIRMRLKGDTLPICDLFFTKQVNENGIDYVQKIDSWEIDKNKKASFVFAPNEKWAATSIFPLRRYNKRGLNVFTVNDPSMVAIKQYGTNALTTGVVRSELLSHNYPFKFLPWLWRSRA